MVFMECFFLVEALKHVSSDSLGQRQLIRFLFRALFLLFSDNPELPADLKISFPNFVVLFHACDLSKNGYNFIKSMKKSWQTKYKEPLLCFLSMA